MAKTPKLKNSIKPSIKSRAFRRATSPALENNLDKSLRDLPRASSPSSTSRVLGPRPNAGITKKKSIHKVLKRKQKIRLEQGKEKAEDRYGKLERKVERAERMREGKKGRNTDWEDVNEQITRKKRTKNKSKNPHKQEEGDIPMDEVVDAPHTDQEQVDKPPLASAIKRLQIQPTASALNASEAGLEDEIT